MPEKKTHKKITENKEYAQLVGKLSKAIQEAKEKGVDITERVDLLTCCCCGAYEDIPLDDRWGVYLNNIRVKDEKFVMIHKSSRFRVKNDIETLWVFYTFICSICGAYQKETVKEVYPVLE